MANINRYEIKPYSQGKKSGWIVVMPSGKIANNHVHDTYESAQKHMETLKAFWPEVKDGFN